MKLLLEDQKCGTRKVIATIENQQQVATLMQEYLFNYGFDNYLNNKPKRTQRKFNNGTSENVFDFGIDSKLFILQA